MQLLIYFDDQAVWKENIMLYWPDSNEPNSSYKLLQTEIEQ